MAPGQPARVPKPAPEAKAPAAAEGGRGRGRGRGPLDGVVGGIRVLDPTEETIRARDFSMVCDARSPGEFAEDRVVGAESFPVLDNDERAAVGTLYAAEPFEARRKGAALVAANLAGILRDPRWSSLGKDSSVLVYCWRGGDRSLSLALFLSRVGWKVTLVKQGYKGYRRQVREFLQRLDRFDYHVVAGRTGSAKGKLLDALKAHGGQVLDLEALANHKGSILGDNPASAQPSQKMFDSRLFEAMQDFDADGARPVFVEGESSMVGKVHLPKALWSKMKVSPCSEVILPVGERVKWTRSQYRYFETTHVHVLKAKVQQLPRLVGKAKVAEWLDLIDGEQWDAFVEDMLHVHYDPAYENCAKRDRAESPRIDRLEIEKCDDAHYDRAALQLLRDHDPGCL